MNKLSFRSCQEQDDYSYVDQLLSEFKKTALKEFSNKSEMRILPKGSYLIQTGEISPCIWYLESGIAHVFFQKEDIKITQTFIFENELFCIYSSSVMKLPSRLSIQALTEIRVLTVSWKDWIILKQNNHEIEKMEQLLLASWLYSSEETSIQRFFTVKEKYYFLFKKHPQMVQEIPAIYLADYLGTSPETISRIRSKIWDKNEIPDISPFEYLFEKKALKIGADGAKNKPSFQY